MTEELGQQKYSRIINLCNFGDRYVDEKNFERALSQYYEALEILPLPKNKWEASTWILTAIGDTYFLMKNYEKSLQVLQDVMVCPNAIGNSFIHLRLGQVHYELGNFSRARDELTRAYMGEGEEIFADENPKYLIWITQQLRTSDSKN